MIDRPKPIFQEAAALFSDNEKREAFVKGADYVIDAVSKAVVDGYCFKSASELNKDINDLLRQLKSR